MFVTQIRQYRICLFHILTNIKFIRRMTKTVSNEYMCISIYPYKKETNNHFALWKRKSSAVSHGNIVKYTFISNKKKYLRFRVNIAMTTLYYSWLPGKQMIIYYIESIEAQIDMNILSFLFFLRCNNSRWS